MADDDAKKADDLRRGIYRFAVLIPCDGSCARAAPAPSGPAQVATDENRSSWERTFGGREPVRGQA